MGIVFRQSVKTTGVTFLGALLGAVVIYLSTNFIPTQGFGYLRTITNQTVVAAQLLTVGLNSTLFVYILKYPEGDKRRAGVLAISLLVPGILLVLASAVYFLLKQPILSLYQPQDRPLIQQYYVWLPAFIGLFLYNTLIELYLGSQLKVAVAAFTREIVLRVVNIVLICLFGYGLIQFGTLVGGTVLAYIIPLALLVWLAIYKTKSFKIRFRRNYFSKAELKELFHFTWYHSLLSASLTLLGALDVILLPWFDKNGLQSVSVYVVAIFLMSLAQIPYKAMVSATNPVLTLAYQEGDMPKVANLFRRSSENMFIAAILMTLLISCNMHNAVAVLHKGRGYDALPLLTLILLAGRLFDMSTGMNEHLLSISRHYKFSFYFSLLLVVMMFISCWFLIPIWGVYGAAAGTSGSLIIYNIIKTVFVWKRLKMLPLSRRAMRTLIAFAVSGAVGYFFPVLSNPYVDALMRSLCIIVVYGILLFWLNPSEDLRQYVQSIKTQKRLF